MTHGPTDPRWPKVLSLAVHEFRTPITVAAGYIRMLLKERAGPISDQQKKLLEEAEKACGRLSALVAEMSDLSNLEGGTANLSRSPVELGVLLSEAVAALPEMSDHPVQVELQPSEGLVVPGDAPRLKTAAVALLVALRRELIQSDRLLIQTRAVQINGTRAAVIAIGDHEQIDAIVAADPQGLQPFDEWRGGSGLSLGIARRVIAQHGGALLSPPGEGKAGAVITLPTEVKGKTKNKEQRT